MALSDMETEWDDEEYEYQCVHGKWDSEDCPVCDADPEAEDAGADADGTDATDEPEDEV